MELIELGDRDPTDYPLVYTMKVKPIPLTRTLYLYRLPSNLHDEGNTELVGLGHLDLTDYPLLYTTTGNAEPVALGNRDAIEYPLLITMNVRPSTLD